MQNVPCDNEFYLQEMKKIHINGVTLTLVLKQRHGAAYLAMLLLCIFARRFSWSRGLCDDYRTAEENLLNNQPFSFFSLDLFVTKSREALGTRVLVDTLFSACTVTQ